MNAEEFRKKYAKQLAELEAEEKKKEEFTLLFAEKTEDVKIEWLKNILSQINVTSWRDKGKEVQKISINQNNIDIIVFSAYSEKYQDFSGPEAESRVKLSINEAYINVIRGYSICTVISIFLLRRLYNDALESLLNKNIFYGEVYIESENPETAESCYKKAYRQLGFIYKNREDTDRGYKIYFTKGMPLGGWQPIRGVIEYTNAKGITYNISEEKITIA